MSAWQERAGRFLCGAALSAWIGASGLADAAPQPMDASEAQQSIAAVDSEIGKMREDLDIVAKGYGTPIDLGASTVLERRLREGEIHFLLNDYLRAAIVLLEVVENTANQSHPRYDDCVYFLAESLRRTENYAGAREYFEALLPRARGDRLKDVVLALLEIASTTRRYQGVDGYLTRLREGGGLSRPDVDYIHGKMLFREGLEDPSRLPEALSKFDGVPSGTAVSAQAAYYAGATLVRLGKLAESLPRFEEAANRAKALDDKGALRELSALARGRVYHELGETSKAFDAYADVAYDSPNLMEMLYEVAWTHVKAANRSTDAKERERQLTLALRTSEILDAAGPDARLFPEARILEGNLQIQLGATESAYDSFQSIIDRYDGARAKLVEMMTEIADPKAFFEQLVAEDLRTVGSTTFLPPVAVEWASRSPRVQQAAGVLEDMRQGSTYLREARELVRTMNEALDGEQRYAMFPALAEARAKAYSIENRLVLLNRRLLTVERRMIGAAVDERSAARLDVMEARRRSLEADVQLLPQTVDQVQQTTGEIAEQYLGVERRAFRQSYQIASARAQVAAVDVWLVANREKFPKAEVELMAERVKAARQSIGGLELELDALAADIRTAKAISGGDGGRVRARRIRASYASVMNEEFELLASMRGSLGGEMRGLTPGIDGARAKLAALGDELNRLQAALDEQINTKVSEIRAKLALELQRLDAYAVEEATLRGESDGVLGPVAAESLRAVEREFKELVRKADVGIIDVAWARKQAETNRVNELVQRQQSEVQELEIEFSDVLEGD